MKCPDIAGPQTSEIAGDGIVVLFDSRRVLAKVSRLGLPRSDVALLWRHLVNPQPVYPRRSQPPVLRGLSASKVIWISVLSSSGRASQ